MTRTEIEALTGLEIDEYISLRVMGNLRFADCDKASTNLNQAMQAAEKVANGQFIRIENQVRLAENRFSQRGWVCLIGNMAAGVGYAITPALALCRAVITANEAKEAKP